MGVRRVSVAVDCAGAYVDMKKSYLNESDDCELEGLEDVDYPVMTPFVKEGELG